MMRARHGLLTSILLFVACATADPWPDVQRQDQPAAYERYLREHPDSMHAPEARERLQAIVAEAERAQAEETATREGTLAAYRDYVTRFPDTAYAATAEGEIARLEEEAAWTATEAAEGDEAVAAHRAFLERYPDSEHAETCRQVIAESERRAEIAAALAVAREADTLAGWESFWRTFSQEDLTEDQRREAGQRIEELGSHPDVDWIRHEIATREYLPPKKLILTVSLALAPPGSGDHILMKDEDYRYLAFGAERMRVAEDAFELPMLRYTKPREVVVLRLTRETLESSEEVIEKAILRANYTLVVQHLGLDFMDSTMLTPMRDPAAFGAPDTRDPNTKRGYMTNMLAAEQLVESLPKVNASDRAWLVGKLEREGWTPASVRERAFFALAAGRPEDAAELGRQAAPHVSEVLLAGDAEIRVHAAHALALLAPNGALLEPHLGDEEAHAALVTAIHASPSIAGRLRAARARGARDEARELLLAEFQREDEAARFAGRNLAYLGWDPDRPENAVRILALEDRWDEIPALGEPAVEPLARTLVTCSYAWRSPILRALERLADEIGPSPAANRLLRTEPRVRSTLVIRGGQKIAALFDEDGRDYLGVTQAVEPRVAMPYFIERTEDPVWDAVQAEWEADAAGRPLTELVEEGRIRASSRGAGIESVTVSFENLTDHPVRVVARAGLRFASGGEAVQDMVSTRDVYFVIKGGGSAGKSFPVACANIELAVPGGLDKFELGRVQAASELATVLARLNDSSLEFPARQAAVWIVTDDASYSRLGRLRRGYVPSVNGIGPPVERGERVIGAAHVVQGLQVLHAAGVDLRARRIWNDRERLAEGVGEGELGDWLQGLAD